PVAMTLYTFIGIAVTSASAVVFGHAIWSPIELIGRFHQPVVAFIALIALLVATLNVNIGANVVSPSNDFSNLAPKLISYRTGGLITGCIGLAIRPWKLMANFDKYLGWLTGYSGLLGPVAGIMVADYFFIRRRRLILKDLYEGEGAYRYQAGINVRAIVALLAGIALPLGGLLMPYAVGHAMPRLHLFYEDAWFVGFGISAALYTALMWNIRPQHHDALESNA
ncbi:MAG: cytosine permease, partial [Terracidiphilus sp.]|nr:cytosine permease [Terracidiphilus sp.]